MKKLYATILASLLGSAALMAQSTVVFVHNGEVVPNGGTVTVTEVEKEVFDYPEWGISFTDYKMESGIYLKNTSSMPTQVVVSAVGLDNYDPISVCAGGSCIPWDKNGNIKTEAFSIPANGEVSSEIHAGKTDEDGSGFSLKGSLKVKVAVAGNENNASEITIIFDSSASALSAVANDNAKVEVFNLCGKKIANSTIGLNKGVYIIRQGKVSRKITIK